MPAGIWCHELKLDRCHLHACIAKDVRVLTRHGLIWADRYRATRAALAELGKHTAYIDGEICVLRPDGTTIEVVQEGCVGCVRLLQRGCGRVRLRKKFARLSVFSEAPCRARPLRLARGSNATDFRY
jgi:hypothetical protein